MRLSFRNEVDIQTEEITTRTRWTQEPPTDLKGCGRDKEEAEISDEEEEEDTLSQIRKTNAVRLASFISSVGQCLERGVGRPVYPPPHVSFMVPSYPYLLANNNQMCGSRSKTRCWIAF